MKYQPLTALFFKLIFIALLGFTTRAVGQEQSSTLPWDLNTEVQNCETSLVFQDLVSFEARKHIESKKQLIVIVRPGSGETSTMLTRRRIFNIKRYFLFGRGNLESDQFIVATGGKVEGLGRYEFYIDGKLFQVLLMGKNRYLCHSCCGPDEEYYPEKADKRKPRKRKR
jgi:hypothetical protein